MKYRIVIQKVNFVAALLMVLLLPISKQWITYFMAFWILTWILEGGFNIKKRNLKNKKLWLLISFYLINTFSILYSINKSASFSIIQTQISLVLIPLVFVSVNNYYKRKYAYILIAYILGVFLFSVHLFYNTVYLNQGLYFQSEMNLSYLLEIANKFSSNYGHRSYLSLHFCLGIIFAFYLFQFSSLKFYFKLMIAYLIVHFFISILLLNSRAALIVMIFLTFYFSFKFLKRINFFIRCLVFVLIIIGFGYTIMQSRLSQNIKWFVPKILDRNEVSNLYSNGNFAHGSRYWEPYAPDIIVYEIIDSPYGKALRIKRDTGKGWWSLRYVGRKITYHKDLTYKFHFKLKVIKGDKIPFSVGWWVNEQGAYKNDLKISVVNLKNGWLDCSAEYTFVDDHQDLVSFINSQYPNTTFDITDIELTCNDSLNRIKFVDQKEDIRISLWKNAFIVWKGKPLFGHGIGDTQEAIVKVHQERNITEAIESKLNAHNQFLETAMQTGLLGLIVLLLVFSVPLYQSIKKKQELLFLFLMICFINFLFESMLQRLAGVVFFSFWYSFLWFVYYKDEKEEEPN